MNSLRITALAVVIMATLVATACSKHVVQRDQQRIAIANGVYLLLPQAAELTESFNATQAITAEYGDRSSSFEAHIETRPGKITIAALSALGAAMFSITFDGMELRASGPVEEQLVNAEYVLADVLLAHWDPVWLNRRLEGAVIQTSLTSNERFVTRDDELIIGITYDSPDPWGGEATLTHIERQYVLHITTAEFTVQ